MVIRVMMMVHPVNAIESQGQMIRLSHIETVNASYICSRNTTCYLHFYFCLYNERKIIDEPAENGWAYDIVTNSLCSEALGLG